MLKTLSEELFKAIKENNTEVVALCLEQGISPNEYEDWAKIRPLHFAVANNAYETAQILIAAGANPFAEDAEGESPFELARVLDNKRMTSLFIGQK